MNEKGNKERQGALSLLLIFREHLLRIQLAWWHATVHPVSPSRLQIQTADSLPPAVHGVNADVPLGGRGNMLPILFTMSHTLSCVSLRTCAVLFQFMSTAGPRARCSEFNERNYLGVLFPFFLFSFSLLFVQQQTGQRAHLGTWHVI